MYQTLITSLENNILTITINRPDKLNALNKDVFTDLNNVATEIENNAKIKSAIITGAGPKAFVAGADIAEFGGLTKKESMALSKRGQDIFARIENCSKPIVAAVNGFALGGGCELAMSCHFRIASDNAKFGQPEVNLGIIPGYGGTQRLIQLIGKGKAMELLMTGDMVGAEEALSLGLVNYVVEPDQLLDKAKELASKINTKGPLAIKGIIRCVNGHFVTGVDGFALEARSFGELADSGDFTEGTSAFIEKRKPVFKGN